jgi:DNA-binding NarL/FixJ family response regulator
MTMSRPARTVQKHLEHIFQKLGVETRTAAAT